MTSFVINTREAGLAGVGRARGRVPGGVRSLVGSGPWWGQVPGGVRGRQGKEGS